MNSGSNQSERPLRAKLRELGLLSREQEAGLPQFLMFASEHAGSRQIAKFLQFHPGCGLPDALGTRFFSSRHQWYDLDWYVRALGSDAHLVRGEWTASYVLLPVKTIRLIQELLPQLKLVFLFRDPAVEAWHAWQESRQKGQSSEMLSETWPWARADFLGQLRRWRSVFHRDQFLIGFEEQIHSEAGTFVNRLLEFLGIEPAPLDRRDILEMVAPAQPSALEVCLVREACRSRIDELVTCLSSDFCCYPPAHWTAASSQLVDSDQVAQLRRTFATVVNHEFDDLYLSWAVRNAEANSRSKLHSSVAPMVHTKDAAGLSSLFTPDRLPALGDGLPQLVREAYRGFNIVAFQHEFIALPLAAGKVDLPRLSRAAFDAKVKAREFLRARTLAHAEHVIDAFLDDCEPNGNRAA